MIFYIFCIASLFVRNIFGVDLEDEPYRVSSVFQVIQGNIPLMSIWDGHTGYFLMVPFGIIYKWFVPSLDGVILFFRWISFSISIIMVIVDIKIISNKYNDKNAWIFLLPACFLSPVLSITYNTASSLLLCTVCCLLYSDDSKEKNKIRYFIIGILMGLVCLNYPTFSLIAIFLLFYIFIKNRDSVSKTVYYLLGVAIVGILFFVWIFLNGSFQEFLVATDHIINGPHSIHRGPINFDFLYRTFIVGGGLFFKRKYFLIIALYLIVLLIINKYVKEKNREIYSIYAFIIFCIASFFPNRIGYGYSIFGIAFSFCAMMFIVDRKFIQKHAIFYIIVVLFVLIYSFTSDNKNVMLGITSCGHIISFTIILTLYERIRALKCDEINNLLLKNKKSLIIAILVLSLLGIGHSYGFIYNDSGILSLNSKITKGVFSGQYTTSNRANYVENMEEFVNININSIANINEKKLSVVTLEPMVYLMSDAEIYTPWTFDVQYLFKGYFSSKPLVDYYKQYKEYPQILFATNKNNPDFYNNSKYEINNLINEKYILLKKEQLADDVIGWIWILKDDSQYMKGNK